MADFGLDDLYQQVVMDHGASPRNMRHVAGAQWTAHGFNPFCGDLVDIEVRMDGNTIADVGFTGRGCAISKASTSLMTEAIRGVSEVDARKVFSAFQSMITDAGNGSVGAFEMEDLLGDLEALSGVSAYPTRIKCAMLGWHTLMAALDRRDDPKTVSTE